MSSRAINFEDFSKGHFPSLYTLHAIITKKARSSLNAGFLFWVQIGCMIQSEKYENFYIM